MSALLRAPSGIALPRLQGLHRAEVLRHLLRLQPEDRRLRFGQAVRDEAIERYVAAIDFSRDRVFGVFAPDLELHGVAHLALDAEGRAAELGLSVDSHRRRHGYGAALLERAVLAAANLGCRSLYMHCLSENKVMMRLAAKAGLRTVVERGEADACLALDRRRHGGAMREAMEDQIALIDGLFKQQAAWLPRAGLPPVPPHEVCAQDDVS